MIPKLTATLLAATSIATGEAAADQNSGQHVPALIARATLANEHLMRGDIAAYRQAMDVAPDFILMDPFGGAPTPTPRSEEHWQRIGRFFRDGRDAQFEAICSYQSGDMIVLVANERAHVGVGSLPPQDWSLRVTLVFRRDNDAWRLVHRHADPLVKGISLEQAGRITLGQTVSRAAE